MVENHNFYCKIFSLKFQKKNFYFYFTNTSLTMTRYVNENVDGDDDDDNFLFCKYIFNHSHHKYFQDNRLPKILFFILSF